jgi:hypothetical protein
MAGEHERAWLRAIGKKLRDDLGDCPTLPAELVQLLDKIRQTHSDQPGERRIDPGGYPRSKK